MGFLVWLIVGLLVAVIVRQVGRTWRPDSGSVPLSAGAVGGLIGGYVADLFMKGDAVAHFHGPSAGGAILGALILLGLFMLIGWTAEPRRDHRPPSRT